MALNLGMVRPGSTILIPFHTFTSDDPSESVAIADFVLADIGIYKGTSMDERASTTGVVLLDTDGIDIDGVVGIGGFSIDLSSNATAGFYSAGSHYYVTVGPVTIDGATVNFVAATFSIGFPDAIINTTVASATSDTQFILTDGPAEADVLIGCPILIQAIAAAVGVGIQIGYCSDYIVTTKEVFLAVDPGGGTVTAGDHVAISMPLRGLWDEILTGANHNIADSAGRRLRDLQEFGTYEGGAVWIHTSGGVAGTTDFENGTNFHPVDSIADANTIAASIPLVRFEVAPGSSITFPGAQIDEVWEGRDWTLALGGVDITGSFILGAEVTGIGVATDTYELEECDIGAVTLDNDGHFERCALTETFTVGQAGTFTFHQCFTEAATTITIDFAALGATAVHLLDFHGQVNFKNMAAGDTVHITGAGTITTETCTAGTIDHDGFFEYTDAGGNVTEQQSDIKVGVDAILPKKNTALSDLEVLMVDSTDHITPKAGLTLGVTRSIDGGAFGAGTGTAAEVANGIYQYDASIADMNGTIITFRFTGTAADDTFLTVRTSG